MVDKNNRVLFFNITQDSSLEVKTATDPGTFVSCNKKVNFVCDKKCIMLGAHLPTNADETV